MILLVFQKFVFNTRPSSYNLMEVLYLQTVSIGISYNVL